MPTGNQLEKVCVVAALLTTLLGCTSLPPRAQIESDLPKYLNPSRIESQGAGEGDADHVYWNVHYRDSSGTSRRLELGYERVGTAWRRISLTDSAARR